MKASKKDKVDLKFYNSYELGLDVDRADNPDQTKMKIVEVDLSNREQLFKIIKKKGPYVNWQPDHIERKKLIRALEKLDGAPEKPDKEI